MLMHLLVPGGHENGHISHLHVTNLIVRHVGNPLDLGLLQQILELAYQPQQDDSEPACYCARKYFKSSRCI